MRPHDGIAGILALRQSVVLGFVLFYSLLSPFDPIRAEGVKFKIIKRAT
jgi:hypothetical protein